MHGFLSEQMTPSSRASTNDSRISPEKEESSLTSQCLVEISSDLLGFLLGKKGVTLEKIKELQEKEKMASFEVKNESPVDFQEKTSSSQSQEPNIILNKNSGVPNELWSKSQAVLMSIIQNSKVRENDVGLVFF